MVAEAPIGAVAVDLQAVRGDGLVRRHGAGGGCRLDRIRRRRAIDQMHGGELDRNGLETIHRRRHRYGRQRGRAARLVPRRHRRGTMVRRRHGGLHRTGQMRGGRRRVGQAKPARIGCHRGLAFVGAEDVSLGIPGRAGLIAGGALHHDADPVGEGRERLGMSVRELRLDTARRGAEHAADLRRIAGIGDGAEPLAEEHECRLLYRTVLRGHSPHDGTFARGERDARSVDGDQGPSRQPVEKRRISSRSAWRHRRSGRHRRSRVGHLPFALDEGAGDARPVLVRQRSLAIGLVVVPLAVIFLAVGPDLHAMAFGLAGDPFAFIAVAIGPDDQAVPVERAILPFAIEAISLRIDKNAGAVRLAVHRHAGEMRPVAPGDLCLAVYQDAVAKLG